MRQISSVSDILPAGWLIEAPMTLKDNGIHLTAAQATLLSRYSLLELSTFCSVILLCHTCASWWIEYRARKGGSKADGERFSVPRREGRRLLYYILFTSATSAIMISLKLMLQIYNVNLWKCTLGTFNWLCD